jgi:uncharacterized protein (DUF4415 family)
MMSRKAFSAAEREKQLAYLRALPDDQIDTSDIPEISEEQWATARRGNFYRPIKKPVTIRIDADVLAWFKDHVQGRGYQSEINKVLRQHVVAAEKAPKA